MISVNDFTNDSLVYTHQIDNLIFGLFDMGNVLYHSNYLPICEAARENFLRSLGTSYGALMAEGFHLPVVHLEQKFIKPILYEVSYVLDLHIIELTNTKIKFGCIIRTKHDASLINLTTTLHTCVTSINGIFKVAKIPADLTNLINKRIGQSNG